MEELKSLNDATCKRRALASKNNDTAAEDPGG